MTRWALVGALLLGLGAPTVAQGVAVNSVRFSPDGTQLVTAASDRTLRVYDSATGALVQTLPGHDDYVVHVAWLADGRGLASASYDGTVKLWDLATGELTRTLRGHTGTLFYVDASPDGTRLASTATEGELIVWDLTTEPGAPDEIAWRTQAHDEVTAAARFSPDGALLVTAGRGALLKLWNAATGDEIASWRPAGLSFVTAGFSPDGQRVAGAGSSGKVVVYDIAGDSGGEASVAPVPIATFDAGGFVNALTFARGGTHVAAACGDGTLRLWSLETGDEVWRVRADADIAFFVDAAPDEQTLATVGQGTTIKLWEASSGERLRTIR
ncbi:MAG: WD40 repeat domain-containing protein [Bacteroidota bacterium]